MNPHLHHTSYLSVCKAGRMNVPPPFHDATTRCDETALNQSFIPSIPKSFDPLVLQSFNLWSIKPAWRRVATDYTKAAPRRRQGFQCSIFSSVSPDSIRAYSSSETAKSCSENKSND